MRAGRHAEGIWKVSAVSGAPAISVLKGMALDPHWLPDNRHFLFVTMDENQRDNAFASGAQLMAASIDRPTRAVQVLEFSGLIPGEDPEARYSSAGFLVFSRSQGEHTGVRRRHAEGRWSRRADWRPRGTPRGWFAVSVAGRTVVALNPSTAETGGTPGIPVSRLEWVNRKGEPIGQLGEQARDWTLRLSPDGERAAVNKDEFLGSLERLSNLKTKVVPAVHGVWMPNSRDLAYVDGDAVWVKSSTGEGPARKLTDFELPSR